MIISTDYTFIFHGLHWSVVSYSEHFIIWKIKTSFKILPVTFHELLISLFKSLEHAMKNL